MRSFFDALKESEAQKESVGTIHAIGGDQRKVVEETSDDWNCYKCNASNFKQSIQCHKCHAMRRLNDYR